MLKRAIIWLVFICALMLICVNRPWATDQVVYGPANCQVSNLKLHLSRHTFEIDSPGEGYIVIRKNNPDEPIDRGFFFFNRKLILLRADLKGPAMLIYKDVALKNTNRLTVFLWGSPGASVAIEVRRVASPVPPPEVLFSADPMSIIAGSTSMLSWQVNNSDHISIDNGIGNVAAADALAVQPIETTTYLLAALGPGGSTTASITIVVTPAPPEVGIYAYPEIIPAGDSTILSWSSNNTESCVIEPGFNEVDPNGSVSVFPLETTTYDIIATGPGGIATSSVTVEVVAPLPTVAISAVPETILLGEVAELTWTTTNADNCTIVPGIGSVDSIGSLSISPSETTTYRIDATGAGGSATAAVTLTVLQPPTVEFQIEPAAVMAGNEVALSWITTQADTVTITPDIGLVDVSGVMMHAPMETTTYTINASGPGGSASAQASVSVVFPEPTVTLQVDPQSITSGQPTTLTWHSNNAVSAEMTPGIGTVPVDGSITVSPSEDTVYTIAVNGPGGTATQSALVRVTAPLPTVMISAAPQTVMLGASTHLSWTSTHASYCEIRPNVGAVGLNGSLELYPTATTIYTIEASGPGGTARHIVTVDVVDPAEPPRVEFRGLPLVISQGESATLSWKTVNAQHAHMDNQIGMVNLNDTLIVTPAHTTTYQLTATGTGGSTSANVRIQVEGNPQHQPEGAFGKSYDDLVPPDATIPAYEPRRFGLVTGLVNDLNGSPMADVTVTIMDMPKYGTAFTDQEGRFALPVEGGKTFTVVYQKPEFLTVHRKIYVGWNAIAVAKPVAMITVDPAETMIVFDGNPETIVTHQSTPVADAFGTRACTLIFTGDNQAYFVDSQGNDVLELTKIVVRVTEYHTQASMPADLPPTSAYTYCASLSVDGVARVRFDKPVVSWIDNFLGFDVGLPVPIGFYDPQKGAWEPLDNGLVVRLLDTDSDGIVDALDADGDDVADDLDLDGLLRDEVAGLNDPSVYVPGSTYWRSELSHFTDVDWNFPVIAASGSTTTTARTKVQVDENQSDNDPCYNYRSSYTDDRNRVHHEVIPIPGTNISLHYDSSRTQGYQHVLTVPASGPTVPAVLNRIDVMVTIAGRVLSQTLDPLPNQVAQFVWDGRDFRGQPVRGSRTAKVAIGFVYDGVYAVPAPVARSFALAGIQTTNVSARQEVTLWQYTDAVLRKGVGEIAEGWSLTPHHSMSLAELSFLFKGDGTVSNSSAAIIETVAGIGLDSFSGDGGPATDAAISLARGIAVDAQGNVYLADSWNNRIRKIDTNGTIGTVAGTGLGGFGGDGGPAIDAQINWPYGMTVDDTGNLYIADTYNHRIRKVDRNGIIVTVAGGGTGRDSVPATEAALDRPYGVAVDSEGNLFIADTWNNCIRKVSTNGIINRVAGTGSGGYNGREGMATEINLSQPTDVAVDAEGNVYIADCGNGRILKVNVSGYMTTIGGNPWGTDADGIPAIDATLYPYGLALDRQGNVYIADSSFETYGGSPNNRIRKINQDGIISTVAGTRADPGYGGDGGPATAADLYRPTGITTDAKGNLYFTDASNYRVRKVGPPSAFSSFDYTGDIFFTEPNGQGHIFSSTGRHLATIDLNTGVELFEFGYDPDDHLIFINDQFGNETTIQRDVNGMPTAIVSPDGLTTNLGTEANHELTEIRFADTTTYDFDYTAGLLIAKGDPNGNRFEHQYDATGRLVLDSDEEGGMWQHTVLNHGSGDIQTEVLSAEGNRTTYLDRVNLNGQYTSTITDATGARTVFSQSADELSVFKSLSCGMDMAFDYDVDPEYKFKFMRQMTETTPAALERVVQSNIVYTDTNADDSPDRIARTVSINGKTSSAVQNVLLAQHTITSPENRRVIIDYNPLTLLTTNVSVVGLNDTSYGYDPSGRITSVTVGNRDATFTYNTDGFLETITDPMEHTTTYSYDPVGRITGIRRPDGSSLGFNYDPNGNMTVLTNPSTIDHAFGYNAVNRQNAYNTPMSGSYTYTYDRDRRLTSVNFPSGAQISNFYTNGRLVTTQTPEGNIDYTYLCGTRIDSITKGSESIVFGYDGKLITSETVSGGLGATLSYSYNDDFSLASFTYVGGTTNYSYDNDELLTGSGIYTITRNAQNGLPETVTGNNFALTRTFNRYGDVESQSVTVNSQVISSWILSQDNNGRITQLNESIDGITTNYEYTYDTMGRLETVSKDGVRVEEYGYDENGARIYEVNTARNISSRTYDYDDEDHLLTAGDVTYQYNLDGFLTTKMNGTDITAYAYSSRGELLSVTLPDNTLIEYIHDPLGRRIAKKVDGITIEKYLWQGRTRLLAVYDGNDNVIQRFEYADDRMPVAMTCENQTYLLSYDQVGSLRVVADASGIVVKRINYDTFGNILTDSDPDFSVPLGFAGGLNDRDTGLVRFGYRDYDPDVGRWTAKDPIFFAGGDLDFFGYCLYDPVNTIDPEGLWVSTAIGLASGSVSGFMEGVKTGNIKYAFIGGVAGAAVGAVVGTLAPTTSGAAATLFVNTLFGAISGAAGGATGAGVTGRDLIKAAIQGAVTGAIGGAGGAAVKIGAGTTASTRLGKTAISLYTGTATRTAEMVYEITNIITQGNTPCE